MYFKFKPKFKIAKWSKITWRPYNFMSLSELQLMKKISEHFVFKMMDATGLKYWRRSSTLQKLFTVLINNHLFYILREMWISHVFALQYCGKTEPKIGSLFSTLWRDDPMYSSIPLSAHYWLFVLSTHHLQFRQDRYWLPCTYSMSREKNKCHLPGLWIYRWLGCTHRLR